MDVRGETPYCLVFTNDSCEIRGTPRPGIPVLLRRDGGGVAEAPSDWLAFLGLVRGLSSGTLKTYAEVLQGFWTYLDQQHIDWRQVLLREGTELPPPDVTWTDFWKRVDDDFLLGWRDKQDRAGVLRKTINYRLHVVLRFYWYAQTEWDISPPIIGEPSFGEDGLSRHYPITVSISQGHRGTRGRSPGAIDSAVLFKGAGARRSRAKHTPSLEELDRLYVELGRGGEIVAERDTLMASWMGQAGLRRVEVVGLEVGQIPASDQIEAMTAGGALHILELFRTKGGKVRKVPVTADLLRRTRDFIEFERSDLIARVRARKTGYRASRSIFLSTTTGAALTRDAVTKILSKAFRAAGVAGWPHRIRAAYLTFVTQKYFEVEYDRAGNEYSAEAILLRVAEIAGHEQLETLRFYLDLVVKRHFLADTAHQHLTRELNELSRATRLDRALARRLRREALRAKLDSESDVEAVLEMLESARRDAGMGTPLG